MAPGYQLVSCGAFVLFFLVEGGGRMRIWPQILWMFDQDMSPAPQRCDDLYFSLTKRANLLAAKC